MNDTPTQIDMTWRLHCLLGSTRRLDVASLCSSVALAGYANAERSSLTRERVETGREAARRTQVRGEGTVRHWSKDQNHGANDRGRCESNAVTDCKEWTNILYAGTSWGKTRKSPKGFMAEHTFVNPLLDPLIIGEAVYDELTKPDPKDPQGRIPKYPDFLFLTKYNQDALATGEPMFSMITAPDDVETFIGHVSGPQGPRSNLTRVEVVSEATIHVEIMVLRDEIAHEHWPVLFLCGQENGLGAMRSQGYGRYDVTRFERTAGKFPNLDWDAILKDVDKDQVLAEYQRSKTKLIADGEITAEETEGMISTAAPIKTTLSRKAAVATISTDDSADE
jgi:hypothetical protein